MTDRDNIVLVTIDSLRSDCCGFVGSDDGLTPTMDRLAKEGTVFENAIAPGPATLDSMPVIFSGDFYPRPEPGTSIIDEPEYIRDHMRARDTIPERLSRRGYETAAFTTNPWTSQRFGFDAGFDHFEDFVDVDHAEGRLEHLLERAGVVNDGSTPLDAVELLLNWHRETDMFQSWDTFYDDVVAWTERADEPYFLWIFLVDAHMPFLPAAEFRSQSLLTTFLANLWLFLGDQRFESMARGPLRTAYEDTVEYVDARLNDLVDDLVDDEPVYVVHGDHGEEFGEHGVYGHGQNLSEELIHTPLLVSAGEGGRIERPFSLARMPELLERLADDEPVDGLDQPVVRARNQDPKTAARGVDWKYVATDGEERLYRLTDDGERLEIRDAELRELGRDHVALWRAGESERRAIAEAAGEVAGHGSV